MICVQSGNETKVPSSHVPPPPPPPPPLFGGGWGLETGLTARRNSVGQLHAKEEDDTVVVDYLLLVQLYFLYYLLYNYTPVLFMQSEVHYCQL